MLRTIKAEIGPDGDVRLLEDVRLQESRLALVTILDGSDEESAAGLPALLSERALAEDWSRPEEEEAWSHLQPER